MDEDELRRQMADVYAHVNSELDAEKVPDWKRTMELRYRMAKRLGPALLSQLAVLAKGRA